jgi:hypothetical protein
MMNRLEFIRSLLPIALTPLALLEPPMPATPLKELMPSKSLWYRETYGVPEGTYSGVTHAGILAAIKEIEARNPHAFTYPKWAVVDGKMIYY